MKPLGCFKNENLNEARNLWQTAVAGYNLHVAGLYGVPTGSQISEEDICAIINGTEAAFDRMSQALELMAKEIDK